MLYFNKNKLQKGSYYVKLYLSCLLTAADKKGKIIYLQKPTQF